MLVEDRGSKGAVGPLSVDLILNLHEIIEEDIVALSGARIIDMLVHLPHRSLISFAERTLTPFLAFDSLNLEKVFEEVAITDEWNPCQVLKHILDFLPELLVHNFIESFLVRLNEMCQLTIDGTLEL